MDSELYIPTDTSYTLTMSSEVIVKDLVVFKRGGKIVGQLDAKVDFKDLSPELHMSAIDLLNGMRTSLWMHQEEIGNGSQSIAKDSESVGREADGSVSVWQKIKKYFKGSR